MFNSKTTERGFQRLVFRDHYGVESSIQQSSGDTEAIWFGVDDADPRILATHANRMGFPNPSGETTGWVPFHVPNEVLLSTRMLLTTEQVRNIIPVLQRFVDTGKLDL